MNTSDWIAILGLFATTIGSVIVLAFYMGSLYKEVKGIAKAVEVLPWVTYTLAQLVVKVDVLWQEHMSKSNSPIVLNEAGLRVLEASKIGDFASTYYGEILLKVKATKPQNPYQAQQTLISVLSSYQHVDECRPKLEELAFSSGSDVNSLLFVAALTIRDRIILELGFSK